MASTNIFALLDDESGAPQRGDKKGKAALPKKGVAAPIPQHSFPGEQPAGKQAVRVPKAEKDHHVTAGGARGGRGGSASRGGRGGRAARATTVGEDHSHREFDRRGAPTKHAPKHAHRDGAALGPEGGAAGPVHQGETVAEATAEEEIVQDVEIPVFEEVDPEDDGSQTYEQYLAAKEARRVAEDSERQVRAVEIDESQFKAVKPLVREDDKAAADAEAEAERAANRNSKKQRSHAIINLDEFRGGREADSKYKAPFIGGPSRGGFDSARGGRGGFSSRGGRGGAAGASSSACYSCGQEGHRSFECPTPKDGAAPRRPRAAPTADGEAPAAAAAGDAPARGGRGGARGGRGGFAAGACYGCGQEGHRAADCPTKDSNPAPRRGGAAGGAPRGRGAPRGGRGGFNGAAVPLNDKSAFPALGQ